MRRVELSDLILATTDPHLDAPGALPDILGAIRQHLGMEVAFVSEFLQGRRVFRHVVADGLKGTPIQPGMGDPLEASYCQRVVDGRLPQLMTDARQNAEAALLPVTHALPVGAHLSVPIYLEDGRLYGTFCAFSTQSDSSLNQRDLQMMRVFAQLAGKLIQRERSAEHRHIEARERIESVLREDKLHVVFQPIVHLESRRVIGLEALSRFSNVPPRSPDVWFNEANAIGLGGDLERKAVALALAALPRIPEPVYVSVNMSPGHVLNGALDSLLADQPLSRVVLELTEHHAVASYLDLAQVLLPLRQRGLQVAVDDAGAGYASFRHILNLAPDRIKLDMSIVRKIHEDPSRRAVAAAYSHFASDTGCKLIAEGVESAAELDVLQELGVSRAQGNYLGPPAPLSAVSGLVLH